MTSHLWFAELMVHPGCWVAYSRLLITMYWSYILVICVSAGGFH
jgi:hypothetical protein